ncbi:MAG: family 78 glycoside hydrolase catalytic domain [Bacteroidia bacterium]|nr:family 78 glycoside hydrolase catalytic domain [Bacteroidia bacterium]
MNKIKIIYFISFILNILVINGCKERSSLKITELKCQSAVDPIGIDMDYPTFSWTEESLERGKQQSAYQIIIADNKEDISHNKGTYWDSGKINSDNSKVASYGGETLKSNQFYYWKIRIWDEDGQPTKFSKSARFTTSILDQKLWKANWIGKGDSKDPINAEGFYQNKMEIDDEGDSIKYNECSLLLRKEYQFSKPIAKALVHICGLGLYELTINGKRIGDKVLNPAKTNYNRIVLYDTYDVTNSLGRGTNAFGIMLGNGWFNPIPKWWSWRMQWFGEKRCMMQMHIIYCDGSTEIIAADETWKLADGPVRRSCLYDGEIYDATKELSDWDKPGFDDSNWVNAKLIKPPLGKLTAQILPAIKRVELKKPVSVTHPDDNITVVDFGQNFSGWIRIRLKGEKGKSIVFRYAEDIKNGMLDTTSNHLAIVTDSYISKGSKRETYEPHFTYHGFQYVEVSGLGYKLSPRDIDGIVVHSAVEPNGEFECSNEQINNVHKAILWSQRSNLMGYPTDCPQREERLGWLGDAHISAEEAIYNFDMNQFYKKWLNDIKANQDSNGYIPYIAPRPISTGGDFTFSYGSGYHLITWYHYLYYGDKQILVDHYESMKRYVDFLSTMAKGFILPKDKYGDWANPLEGEGWERGDPLSLSTGFYYSSAIIVTKVAKILGYERDAEAYSKLADSIKKAYNEEFLNVNAKLYDDSSQFANSFPLFLGIVPEDFKKDVLNNLINDIISREGHLTTGIFGTKYLMETLSREGRNDIAWGLATQSDYPSWINMIGNKTTLSEHWGEKGMNSHNHIMFGSIDSWFYKILGGIQVDENSPGFRSFIIKPYVPSDLSWVKASVKTISGTIRSEWTKQKGILSLKVFIPVGTTATVYILAKTPEEIQEGSSPAIENKNVSFLKMENEYAIFNVESGEYNFFSNIIE